MSKFLIINILVLAVFIIFMSTNSFVHLTALGYIFFGFMYLIINFFIYFGLRFLTAVEHKNA